MTKFNIFVIIIKQFATRTVPYAQIAQLVEQRTENPRVLGSIPSLGIIKFICANGSVVEHRLAKARAASSNLVSRLTIGPSI